MCPLSISKEFYSRLLLQLLNTIAQCHSLPFSLSLSLSFFLHLTTRCQHLYLRFSAFLLSFLTISFLLSSPNQEPSFLSTMLSFPFDLSCLLFSFSLSLFHSFFTLLLKAFHLIYYYKLSIPFGLSFVAPTQQKTVFIVFSILHITAPLPLCKYSPPHQCDQIKIANCL